MSRRNKPVKTGGKEQHSDDFQLLSRIPAQRQEGKGAHEINLTLSNLYTNR